MASSRPSRIRVRRTMSAMRRIFVYIAVYMILLSVRYQYVLTSPETFTVTTNVYLCPSPRAAQLRSTRIIILFNLSHKRGKRRGRLQAAVHAVVFLRRCLAFFNFHQSHLAQSYAVLPLSRPQRSISKVRKHNSKLNQD